MPYKAYTLNIGRDPSNVVTDAWVANRLSGYGQPMPPTAIKCRAKWDTGCNMTCITHDIANRLNLSTYRQWEVRTPDGLSRMEGSTLISMMIPTGQVVPSIEVCVAHMVDADILVGMDIIAQGDFALSHTSTGEVIMSICFPPLMTLDLEDVVKARQEGLL